MGDLEGLPGTVLLRCRPDLEPGSSRASMVTQASKSGQLLHVSRDANVNERLKLGQEGMSIKSRNRLQPNEPKLPDEFISFSGNVRLDYVLPPMSFRMASSRMVVLVDTLSPTTAGRSDDRFMDVRHAEHLTHFCRPRSHLDPAELLYSVKLSTSLQLLRVG